MKRFSLLLFCMVYFMPVESSSLIRTINHFQGLESELCEVDPETTLVVFDVDFTITRPKNPAFQFEAITRYADDFRELMAEMDRDQQDLFATLAVTMEAGAEVAEPGMVGLIRSLQNRKTKVIALTAMLTGDLGEEIGNICKARCKMLEESGICFSESFPDFPNYMQFPLWNSYRDNLPEYRRGVLFSNGEGSLPDKGQMLLSFLDRLCWVPEHIVFVDDKRDHLVDVAEALEKIPQEVHLTGIHYKAVRMQPATAQLSRVEVLAEWERLIEFAKAVG